MKTFKDTEYGDLTGKVYKGYINVSYQDLDSLEGAPKEVYGSFICYHNNLTLLEGAPKEVHGSFNCSNNELKTLEYAPEIVNGFFDCGFNNLTSLEGAPKIVESSFSCSNNNLLLSLKGSPKIVDSDFYCRSCPKLKSLDELLDTEIKGKLYNKIMTDKEFRKNQELYKKAGKNIKKYKLLKKLKGIK